MSPLIQGGDILEIVPPLRLKPGMIVLVNTPWGPRCHRIVAVQGGKLVLKGDSLQNPEEVLREQVVGKVQMVWRGKRAFSPYQRKWWLYGVLHTHAPQITHAVRKIWRWSRRHRKRRV